jgi:hypothetical protein
MTKITDTNWEHIGEAGPHAGHHLHCDDMQDVHCLECGLVLEERESDDAWPVDEERAGRVA